MASEINVMAPLRGRLEVDIYRKIFSLFQLMTMLLVVDTMKSVEEIFFKTVVAEEVVANVTTMATFDSSPKIFQFLNRRIMIASGYDLYASIACRIENQWY